MSLSLSSLSGSAGVAGGAVIVHLLRPALLYPAAATAPHGRGGELAARDGESAPLTPREVEVIALLREGRSTRAMADRLGPSPSTVRNHTQAILRKLGAHSRLEAVASATRRGLVE